MTQRPAFTPHARWPSGSPPLMSVHVPPLHTCSDTPLAHPSRVSRDCPRSALLPPLCHLHRCLNSSHPDDCQAAQRASAAASACHMQVPACHGTGPRHALFPRQGHAPLLHPPASPSHLAGPSSAPLCCGHCLSHCSPPALFSLSPQSVRSVQRRTRRPCQSTACLLGPTGRCPRQHCHESKSVSTALLFVWLSRSCSSQGGVHCAPKVAAVLPADFLWGWGGDSGP